MSETEALVQRLYTLFNARELNQAAALFAEEALLEHAATGRQQRGSMGYLAFAKMWIGAFPDAVLAVDRITTRSPTTVEVELRATGTHEGQLDLGGYGLFKPSGTKGTLRLRQILEVRDGKFVYSALSFDVQDIVQQLVVVSVPRLLEQLRRVQQLGARLAQTPEDQVMERRSLIDRLGVELDTARRIVRPYFER